MRDRNHLDLLQFNIHLTKTILRSSFYLDLKKQEEYFSHKSSLWRSDTKTPNSWFRVSIPKDFRRVRALSISVWFFPENVRWLYLIEMENCTFTQFNRKQRIEIKLLLSSQENCVKYLYLTQRYTASELFGNLIGNDFKDLSQVLRLRFVKQTRAKKKVFRRGPKDKGSRRSDPSARIIEFEEKRDAWLNEQETLYQKNELLLQQTVHRILKVLENFFEEEFF